jgi:hypothetical protein
MNTPEKACHRKVAYTKQDAMKQVRIRKGRGGNVYRCPYCRKYHVTSNRLFSPALWRKRWDES